MKRTDLRAGVIYALRTSPRYQPTPVLLVDTRLWNEPKRGHHDRYRLDAHATRYERNTLYGDTGYLVVYGTPDLLGALVLPEQITEDTVATLRAELAEQSAPNRTRDGLVLGVVNNAHLAGQLDDVRAADAERAAVTAERDAEIRAAATARRNRFNTAAAVLGDYHDGEVSFMGGRVEMTLEQFEQIAEALHG